MSENHHQILEDHSPEGHVCSPGMLYGCIGLLIALVLQRFGFFEAVDISLYQVLESRLTLGVSMESLPLLVLVLASTVYSIGVAWGILDSRDVWQRMVILISAMILVVAMVPTLAVWNIYFSPFLVLTSVFCASFCAMIYASRHLMPCDLR